MSASVFLIEDNDNVREPLAALLSMLGYGVSEAVDGQEALNKLQDGPLPDLILLDLMMPGMDGWTFLDVKDSDPRLARIPVVVLSAVAKFKPPNPQSSAVAVVAKPFKLQSLVTLVEQYCNASLPLTG